MTVHAHSFTPQSISAAGDRVVRPDEATPSSAWLSPSAWASFLAGSLTAFTVSVGGEMPLGEIILVVAAGWVVLCAVFNQAWPGPLLRSPLLWGLMAAQVVALGGYIFSDLYRQSSLHDMARGWSRMAFLAVDVLALAYLFGCSRRNFLIFLFGQCLGDVASTAIFGPMFGDMWKFGIGTPLTFFVFWAAPFAGPFMAVIATSAMGVLHFALDYRSLGGICLLAGMLMFLQMVPGRFRLWLAPLGAMVIGAAILWVYGHTRSGGERTTRSDIERSSMVTAAIEAIEESPVIGHGSWFSNSDVYDNFILIQHTRGREAHIGGFPEANEGPGLVALHSQILVALAEGGLFGSAFFLVYGVGLVWALYRFVFIEHWARITPLCTLLLLSALWNLFCSPFSGAHRVYIAMACGLMLLLKEGRLAENDGEHFDQ